MRVVAVIMVPRARDSWVAVAVVGVEPLAVRLGATKGSFYWPLNPPRPE